MTLHLLSGILQTSKLTPAQFARLIASPQKIMIELERSRQLALGSQREALALAGQAEVTYQTGSATFKLACKTVGGSLTEDPIEGPVCHWRHAVGDPRPQAFSESDALKAKYKQEVAASEEALKKRDQYITDAQALQEKYAQASKLGKIVTLLSGAADLDAVLSQVVKAGATTPDSGFIRTPSVVLSKNVLDTEAIGGHNIDLVPARIVTEIKPATGTKPPAGAVVRHVMLAGPAKRTQVITEPAVPVEKVLGKAPSGTLLDEMRARTSAEPSTFAEVSARAKTCNCDAVVSQASDGTILFVRNAPPPLQSVILGKSGLIDAMAAPPALKVVHFENFDRASVESLARTQVLVNSKAQTGGFDRTIGDLKGIFSSDGGDSGGGAEILIARENGEPESLTLIGDYDRRISLKESVSWRAADVREPSATEWETTFGAEPDGDAGRYSRLIVHFGQGAGRRDALGISVGAVESTGFVSRLKLVVSQWLGRQSLRPSPISDALLDLRTAIMTRLKPNHLQFYLKRNGGVIRAAHADFPAEPGDFAFSE
jgi:hypothetical protein